MGRTAAKGDSDKPTVQVTKAAKDALVDWLKANHAPKQGLIVGQILEWFVAQEPEAQLAVLEKVPSRLLAANAVVLRALADDMERRAGADAAAALKRDQDDIKNLKNKNTPPSRAAAG